MRQFLFLVAGLLAWLMSAHTWAVTYTFNTSGGTIVSGSPSICSGAWSRAGTSFTCNGNLSTSAGDVLTVSTATAITVSARSITLVSSVVGTSTRNINLRATSETVLASDSSITGTVTATNGSISLTGGSVSGLVLSNCCTVTTNNTDLLGGAKSDVSSLSVTGGTLQGDFYAGNNPATFTDVNLLSGIVSGASTVTFSDSTLGSLGSSVSVTSQSGPVTLNNTTAYGDFRAPDYSTIVVNSPSTVTGTCLPSSTPANACVPAPLLSWWMNESAWSGSTNEVLDSSGNNLHGRAFNGAVTNNATPALAADANGYGTCRYGEFRSANSRYLQVADNNLLDMSGSFTIGIWVRPISRATQLMSIVSKDTNYEFHIKPDGSVNWWWETTGNATNQFDSTATVPLNAWTHVAIRFSPGSQRIFINGTAAGSASFSGTPRTNNLPFQVGQDQGLGGRYFNGALDELRVYNRALSDAEVLALTQERPALCSPAPDHYELVYASSQALTCNPLDVTVRACQNSSCSSLYASPVTVNLTPSGTPNNWSATPVTFTGSSALQFQRTTAGTSTLGLTGTPAASNALQCIVGGVAGSCAVTFASSGFILNVPNMLANKPTAATLQAVRDDGTQTCVPAWQGDRTVNFTRTYSNPASGTLPVQINGTTVTSSTPLNLNFDSTASAALTVRYADAGLISLSANYSGSSGLDAGLVLTGSDDFVSKPYGLLLQTDTVAGCTAADISCPLYPGGVRAGDPFSLRIKAVAWQSDGEALTAAALADNSVTPNFQLNGIALASQVQAPAGGSNGTLGVSSYSHGLGAQTALSNQSISEVGVFRIAATPSANAYFGETVSASVSGLVGRFAPAFLQASGEAALTPSCGTAFSYQGQPMAFASGQDPRLTVTAFNRQNVVTGNYDRGDFWRLSLPGRDAYLSVTGKATLDTAGRLQALGTLTTSQSGADGGDGARTWRWSGEQLLYTPATVPLAGDLPFNAAIRQGFSAAALTDADGACVGSGSTCQTYSYDFSGSQVRLGRLSIGNAHGSELQPLALPLRLESWQGSGAGLFQLERADTCTAAVLGQPELGTTTGNLGAGDTTASLSSPALVDAQGVISLTAPGAGNDGSVLVGLRTPAACIAGQANCLPDWLWYDWRGNGREAPQGLATFGVYRGAAPLIYRRELYR